MRVHGRAFIGRERRTSAAVTEWKHGNMKPKEGDGKNAKGGRTRRCYAKTCGGETAAVAYEPFCRYAHGTYKPLADIKRVIYTIITFKLKNFCSNFQSFD